MTATIVSRRQMICLGVAGAAATRLSAAAAAPAPPIAGAIRWDAWEATRGSIVEAVEATLAPHQYQTRAPFCAVVRSEESIDFTRCEIQVSMDREIVYAASAGLTYWAYGWAGASNPIANAWKLHQSSIHRNRMNWCLLLPFSGLGGAAAFAAQHSTYLEFFQRENYQKIGTGRPLLYIYVDQISHLTSDWAGDWANVEASLAGLSAACSGVGLGRPYIVVMRGVPRDACNTMAAISADAISNYIALPPSGRPASYSALDTATRAYWAEMANTGAPIIPICMTGWDTRPRKLHPPPWEANQKAAADMETYVAAGDPIQIAANIRAALTYVERNPAICPARTILIYSWNECDEGGSPLVPTYSPAGPNRAILDAVGTVLNHNGAL